MVKSKPPLLSVSALSLLATLSIAAPSLLADAAPLSSKTAPEEKTQSALVQNISTPDENEQSQAFVKNIAERGIGFMENTELSEEKREQEFRKMLEDSFDMKTIGRFALGKYWRQATKQQQKEYLQLFEDMVVNVYSRRFGDYNGEKFVVLSAREQGKDVIVSSHIITASSTPISVDWRVRKKKNRFVVIDIMVEGVSMALTQRSDFAAVIQRGGGKVDVLLEHLRK